MTSIEATKTIVTVQFIMATEGIEVSKVIESTEVKKGY